MRVLVACEFSGVVRDAFARRGHDAWSCDLLPTEIPGNHLECDVLDVLDLGWDLMIAHPECTRLCNSGVRWLHERDLWGEMVEAALFFKELLDAPVPRKVVENPIPHRYAVEIIGRKYDQIIQPHMFGHGETKATCLWLVGLPRLIPTENVAGRHARVHLEPPSPDRWKNRSRFLPGIADAMAEQWGGTMTESRGKYQTVVLTLSDGTTATFTGPAVFFPGETRSIVDVEFTRPKELPEGMVFEEFAPEQGGQKPQEGGKQPQQEIIEGEDE